MVDTSNLFSNIIIEAIKVTESAAIAAAKWNYRGDEKQADQAAVNAMRLALNNIDIDGTVVIGEGERDKAPMLYIGEKVGKKTGIKVDIALDPLEGTTICATGAPGAMAVMAMAEQGGFLHAPDVYMDKIAIGGGYPVGIIDLDNSVYTNLSNLAKAKKCDIKDLLVMILKRERHCELIAKVREAGARIQLISDGDVAGVIACALPDNSVDIYMGIGGAPEGVLAAAALKVMQGQMLGRLIFAGDSEKERARQMGVKDLNYKYQVQDMAKGDIVFSATGVTDGSMLNGIKYLRNNVITNSIIMESRTQTIRNVTTQYHNQTKDL